MELKLVWATEVFVYWMQKFGCFS